MEGLVEGQCERVFGALVGGVGVGGGQQGASVNLVRGPVGVEGMWGVEEGEGFTGMCFCFFFWFCWLFFWFFWFFGGGVWDGGLRLSGDGAGGGRRAKEREMEIAVWFD